MKFKDLQKGEKFITYPLPPDEDDLDDNRPFWIFMKIESVKSTNKYENEIPLRWNAIRERDGILSEMPDDMLIVHIA